MTSEGDNDHVENLFADLIKSQKESSKNYTSTDQWNPEKSGDMDLVIDREGRWIHEGSEIKRPEIVKLFSTTLKFEQGVYYLVTPVEKWQIRVAIAPFYIINATREIRHSKQAIILKTSTDDVILLSDDNPLLMDTSIASEESIPLVTVRENLMGFISRPIYYQLIDWGNLITLPDGRETLMLESMGAQFDLGQITTEPEKGSTK